MRALAASFDLIQQKRKTSHGLEQCHIDTVPAFYCCKDIAQFMPGKQDVVINIMVINIKNKTEY